MPLIEYRCSECARVFEELVSRVEGADTANCPNCELPTGKRLVSVFQVHGGSAYGMATSGGGGCCGASGCACGR
jgi:putative FmdB family regulatory protein